MIEFKMIVLLEGLLVGAVLPAAAGKRMRRSGGFWQSAGKGAPPVGMVGVGYRDRDRVSGS